MLLHLSVENFILIPKLDISLHPGFTCITGETGAGKSILAGALSLALGQRADTALLRDKLKKCIVEARFNIADYGLEELFGNNDLDFETTSIFRREITPQGKSRAFINDTPVNLQLLKLIGDKLVDIHSQHQTLELNQASFQLTMLDSYAENAHHLVDYKSSYTHFQNLKTEIQTLTELEEKSAAERDFIQFQFDELENASLICDEQTSSEEELEALNHAEEIKTKAFHALGLLSDNELNINDLLNEAKQFLDQAGKFSTHLIPLSDRVEASLIELKDISSELHQYVEKIVYDPTRIEQLSGRLNLIYHLQQKHHVKTVAELIDIKDNLSDKLLSISSLESRIDLLKKQLLQVEVELTGFSDVLTNSRKVVIAQIEAEMKSLLHSLGMPGADFKIQADRTETFTPNGCDRIIFLFSANKGGQLSEIQKVASGGELSRLMLAIKSMVIKRSLLPTIIFDEIDSGVSGEIAGKVGGIMKSMAKQMQVIAITHLPQIAGKADCHLMAYKTNDGDTTTSSLKQLTDEQRINEIARMLSDDTVTEAARLTARELLNFN
jgi:DNA repair protein RecN (Recombination protein N)